MRWRVMASRYGQEHPAEISPGPQGFVLATSTINGKEIVKATECTNLELATLQAAPVNRPAATSASAERKRLYSRAYRQALKEGLSKEEAREKGQEAVS